MVVVVELLIRVELFMTVVLEFRVTLVIDTLPLGLGRGGKADPGAGRPPGFGFGRVIVPGVGSVPPAGAGVGRVTIPTGEGRTGAGGSPGFG